MYEVRQWTYDHAHVGTAYCTVCGGMSGSIRVYYESAEIECAAWLIDQPVTGSVSTCAACSPGVATDRYFVVITQPPAHFSLHRPLHLPYPGTPYSPHEPRQQYNSFKAHEWHRSWEIWLTHYEKKLKNILMSAQRRHTVRQLFLALALDILRLKFAHRLPLPWGTFTPNLV